MGTNRRGATAVIVLNDDDTGGLGELRIAQPPGAFALTPASLIAVRTIGIHRQLLAGTGFDWGTGCGVVAMAAAKIATVEHVTGADIVFENVAAAIDNAARNGVAGKTTFLQADSFAAPDAPSRATIDALERKLDFVLANPPSSDGDDGFGFRRVVLRDSRRFLRPGGIVFLSVSVQYGLDRIRGLVQDAPGYVYEGVLASTEWVPFDLTRPDLLACLRQYAAEERRGGLPYSFKSAVDDSDPQRAVDALATFELAGMSPLSKWQTHLFTYG
jgi:SAM-dependent methyltransferase